ncbi:MAG: PQQ-dependent sugar dehydrogenase [Myxococcales bacterium]
MVRRGARDGIGLLCAASCWLLAASTVAQDEAVEPRSWRANWDVKPGYGLERVVGGFRYPTAIAVVPEPGAEPDAVRLFVSEIEGRIKVVRRDGSVATFAEGFVPERHDASPMEMAGQLGHAGICLDPDRGYVFATLGYLDDDGLVRNRVMRFQSSPRTFDDRATGSEVIAAYVEEPISAVSHQIGGCTVVGEHLFVSVGDGERPHTARDRTTSLGKVLRMELSGAPSGHADASDDNPGAAAVWALGLRNPFGITHVGDRVFVTDNGALVDRFVRIEEGRDYLWNGFDSSLLAAADVAFSPSVSPVQVTFVRAGSSAVPEGDGDAFFLATTGDMGEGPRSAKTTGILRFGFDLAHDRASEPPEIVLEWTGERSSPLASLAGADDGLYFSPLSEGDDGSWLYRLRASSSDASGQVGLVRHSNGKALVESYGCAGCHQVWGAGGRLGPSLDAPGLAERLRARLDSDAYAEQLTRLDAVEDGFIARSRAARARIRSLQGRAQLRAWVEEKVVEPRFDDPTAQMPMLQIPREHAELIAEFLLPAPKVAKAVPDAELDGAANRSSSAAPASVGDRLLYDPVSRWVFVSGAFLGALLGLIPWARRVRERKPRR